MSGAYSVVYDTTALLDFFAGTRQGREVAELLEDEDVENIIPTVVLCELAGKLKAMKVDPDGYLSVLEKNCVVVELDRNVAIEAGALHAELNEVEPGISKIDCIIMIHAQMKGAMIVSRDKHFRHYKNLKMVNDPRLKPWASLAA